MGLLLKYGCIMRCCYNAVNFLQNPHKRHPIARPLGRGMGYILFIATLDLYPAESLQWYMQDHVKFMMTSSNGNIFRVTGPLCGDFTGPGEFPTQRPVTRSFDVFFDLRLNKRLSKQSWGWSFGTPSWSLWRHRNVNHVIMALNCITLSIWVEK